MAIRQSSQTEARRVRLIGTVFAALLVLAGQAALAQLPGTPQERMDLFQRMEHEILQNRRALLGQEEALAEPLWLVRSDGSVEVVDGAPLYERVAVAVELAVALGAEEAAPSWLPEFARREIAAGIEAAAKGRAQNIRNAVIEAYREHSRGVRAAALAEIESDLGIVRDGFATAMAERDDSGSAGGAVPPSGGQDAQDWRTVMAERGAMLPAGADMIDPEPTMDRVCKAPAETPIWILVADGSACGDPWKHKGSGEYEGRKGDWCVWCPANMYWRSGWGCCFPN